jgi:hypothetical protein
MTRREDNTEAGIETKRFLSRVPVQNRRSKQIRELGYVIERLDICKPVRKLARSIATQLGRRRSALFAELPEFGGLKGKLQPIDLGNTLRVKSSRATFPQVRDSRNQRGYQSSLYLHPPQRGTNHEQSQASRIS